MLTRRILSLGTVTLAAAALWAGIGLGPASAQTVTPDAATAFVKQTGDALVAVVNGGGSLAEKQQKLTPLINAAVDVDGVGAFCLGRFSRTATPQQKTDFLKLFHTVLVRSVTGKLGDYAGVTFSVGRAAQQEDGVLVSTIVSRPNNQPANVGWLIQNVGGQLRVVDVIAEGTSLRLTQRTDYASFLSHNGDNVQALVDAMKRQVGG